MNKATFVATVAEKAGLTQKQADAALTAVLDLIVEELAKGEKVQLTGFGTFEVRERAAREGRNPATGATIEIAATKTPAFKAGKKFKDAL
ncbi:HU family DNA-binding protein [Bacillota bacterium Meth-B3]|nr:HU family DNA-binding protein [Christensenellaceae bacterium]MEA5069225.1 HU family DNA-binding protein [Christensenellaceae bacterium]